MIRMRFWFGALALVLTNLVWAQGQFIDLYPKSQADLQLILDTLEPTISAEPDDDPPIVMMLHGAEAYRFLRSSYAENKTLIDRTAKLAAYEVIEVKICETWMRANNYTRDDLFPFVSTVPYGAAELERLAEDENYTEYDVDL